MFLVASIVNPGPGELESILDYVDARGKVRLDIDVDILGSDFKSRIPGYDANS